MTDLGVFHFDERARCASTRSIRASSLDDVRAAMAWEPRVDATLATTPPPHRDELRLIREVLDPEGRYTGV